MLSVSTVTPHTHFPAATWLAALLVLVWLPAMGQLLWHFEKQRIAAAQQVWHFDTHDLPAPPLTTALSAIKALYFLDDQCRCNAAALAEIARVQRKAGARLMQFVFELQPSLINAQPLAAAERARWRGRVPPTPAVALWDERGTLLYFGPINVGFDCGGGRSYLESYLQSYLSNYLRTASSAGSQQSTIPFKSWDVMACACSTAPPTNT